MSKSIYFIIIYFSLVFICCKREKPLEIDHKISFEISKDTLDFGMYDTLLILIITNTGTEQITWDLEYDVDWISILQTSGITTTKDTISILVDRSDLSPGNYSGKLMLHTNAYTEPLIITLKMQAPIIKTTSFEIFQDTLDFAMFDSMLTIVITNTGTEEINWNIETDIDWITIHSIQGTTTTTDTVIVTVDRGDLSPGDYSGKLMLYSNANLEPVIITLKMQVPIYGAEKISSGKIYICFRSAASDWYLGSGYKILLKQNDIILASAPIDSLGYFKFRTIKNPDESQVIGDPLYYSVGDCSAVAISNPDAKMSKLNLEIYKDNEHYEDISICNYTYVRKFASDWGDGEYAFQGEIKINYLYLNGDVDITGQTPPIQIADSGLEGIIMHSGEYNISFKKGFNLWIKFLDEITYVDPNAFYDYKYLSTLPEGSEEFAFYFWH